MNKIVMLAILAILIAGVNASLPVQAADRVGEVVMKVGNKVDLFHSGTEDVKKDMCVGDTVPVYRETGKIGEQINEVGQVKILGYKGDHYIEAEIVKGSIKTGDIVKKNSTYCMVRKRI